MTLAINKKEVIIEGIALEIWRQIKNI